MQNRSEYAGSAACLIALLLVMSLLVGCASNVPSSTIRRLAADQQASRLGWVESTLQVDRFELASWAPPVTEPAAHLTVYIEGDGLAWLNAERQSDDPTPLQPMALELALAQPTGARVYLARPCQYVSSASCSSGYWGALRFAPEIIAAMDQAVSQLKFRFGARDLTLVGYSGGGSVAALLAERRTDVTRLVTVAGNLSIKQWTTTHALSGLTGSLDPIDQRARLAGVPQWHFVGTVDHVVPAQLTDNFAAPLSGARVIRIEGFDHQCCWVERWPELWNSTDP